MRRFLTRISCYSSFAVLLVVVVNLLATHQVYYYSSYSAAIIEKHKRIESLHDPKIIFAGGSNLAFGLNSPMIEDEFGVPVVNLGLHGGFGLKFIMEELEEVVRKGDIVIVSTEYFLGSEGSYKLQRHVNKYFAAAEGYYPRNILNDTKLFAYDTKKKARFLLGLEDEEEPYISKVYSADGFNAHGDLVSHLDQPSRDELDGRKIIDYRPWSGIDILNQFCEYANELDVTVYFLYPSYPISEFSKNKDAISLLDRDLHQSLKAVILNRPGDAALPDSCFFDTVYHLNESGRSVRTRNIIKYLQYDDKFIDSINTKGKSL